MKLFVIILALLSLGGCSVIGPKAGPQLAKAVNKYCMTLSFQERQLLREQVNAAIAPNHAQITCAVDE